MPNAATSEWRDTPWFPGFSPTSQCAPERASLPDQRLAHSRSFSRSQAKTSPVRERAPTPLSAYLRSGGSSRFDSPHADPRNLRFYDTLALVHNPAGPTVAFDAQSGDRLAGSGRSPVSKNPASRCACRRARVAAHPSGLADRTLSRGISFSARLGRPQTPLLRLPPAP